MDNKFYYDYMKNLINNSFYKNKTDVTKRLDVFHDNKILDDTQYKELMDLTNEKYGA
ncbi:hypothetical protein AB2T90_19595 [Clostridium butyricum]|uniref:hypothetical protein n=1 Tax=Clostridium butyricum TaxID=1492 RepID=UPI00346647F8